MPNRETHETVGVIAGVATAAFTMHGQELEPWQAGLELVAAGFAGSVTSAIPDRIDRPTSPRHRASAHAVTTGAAIGMVSLSHVTNFQANCRTRAREVAQRRAASTDLVGSALLFLAEAGLYVASGLAAGAPAGWLSHLALDMGTPSRLPLL